MKRRRDSIQTRRQPSSPFSYALLIRAIRKKNGEYDGGVSIGQYTKQCKEGDNTLRPHVEGDLTNQDVQHHNHGEEKVDCHHDMESPSVSFEFVANRIPYSAL